MKKARHRAVEIARTDGLVSLFRCAPSYAIEYLTKFIAKKHSSENSIDREELIAIGRLNDSVWFDEPETSVDAESFTAPAPDNFSDFTVNTGRSFVCELELCRLVGPSAVGFTNERELILESAGSDGERFVSRLGTFLGDRPIRTLRRSAPSSSIPIITTPVFPLVPFFNQYYYHWIAQYLPKLRMLELYESQTGREPQLLIPEDPPSFVVETLSLLGYGSDRCIEWNGKETEVDRLVISNFNIHSSDLKLFEYSRRDYQWLRETVLSGNEIATNRDGGKKIYISRQQSARGRSVLNYDELMEELESRGFESYVMESLPIRKQIQVIADAETIVSPHGAGLTNMIFSEDATIVELFPESYISPYFYFLANVLGFEYEYLISESEENDLIVDIEFLQTVLDDAST
ncbi:glycosyltransferase family 61 protein [Halobellus limi]|uniref:glycosyltransferase family 61 protein n=1 Tax=Halobellus limi TaxID=699433 RepID=UPI0013573B36|nr:glycosyltransferase family 61 protein [Halobellus limi]